MGGDAEGKAWSGLTMAWWIFSVVSNEMLSTVNIVWCCYQNNEDVGAEQWAMMCARTLKIAPTRRECTKARATYNLSSSAAYNYAGHSVYLPRLTPEIDGGM